MAIHPQAVGKRICCVPYERYTERDDHGVALDSATGLYVPPTHEETPHRAVVINIGADVTEVAAGDHVQLVPGSVPITTYDVDGKTYIITRQENVVFVYSEDKQ